MGNYGIVVTPLINILIDVIIISPGTQVGVLAYADDFSAAGKLEDLRKLWDTGPKFGYLPEPTKTWLTVKPYALQQTTKISYGTKIKITKERHRYLKGTVGTEKFPYTFMEEKVTEWIQQLEILSKSHTPLGPFLTSRKIRSSYRYKVSLDPYWWLFLQRNEKEATITSCKIWWNEYCYLL